MKAASNLIVILLLLPLLAVGQSQEYSWPIAAGSTTATKPIPLVGSDTSSVINVTAYDGLGYVLSIAKQPTFTRVGTSLVVKFAKVSALPEQGLIRVKIGSTVKYTIRFTISNLGTGGGGSSDPQVNQQLTALNEFKEAQQVTNVNLLNAIAANTQQITLLQGNVGTGGSNRLVYSLNNTTVGYAIGHNKNNTFVKASFFRADNKQPDILWRIRIDNSNTVTVIGPYTETFTGSLVLEFL